jgi:CTP synthase
MDTDFRTVIVTGGIVSGIGKGITAASLGRLLKNRGFSVAPVKADPYLNQDAGTMNPFQHGEVFVTEDGAETDLDLGHYERFLDLNVTRLANFTSGAVFASVMQQERNGEYLGKTIQIIPHVTDEIRERVAAAAEASTADFLTVEIGGTVGDIEALPFIEALRQFREERRDRTAVVHVVKVDYLYPSDEAKTKPIQHAVATLRGYGLQPDILVVRCKRALSAEEREKISLFTGVSASKIIPARDAGSLYAIPEAMEKAGLAEAVLAHFKLEAPASSPAAQSWAAMRKREKERTGKLVVGMVGKYVQHDDAYLSVVEAVKHAGIQLGVMTELRAIDAEGDEVAERVRECDAVIVPGGFGTRGIVGKLAAIQAAREAKVPFLGICLGLQLAVIEYCRNVLGVVGADSTEFDETASDPVVAFLPGQESIRQKGGTMRLGAYPAHLTSDSLAQELYRTYRSAELVGGVISERHRHRYEVNPDYYNRLRAGGLIISGILPGRGLVEFVELPRRVHPYFIATQAHPEFRSRPELAHPLFAGLVAAGRDRK